MANKPKQCEGITLLDEQCRNPTSNGDFCYAHGNPSGKNKKTPSKKQIAMMERENVVFTLRMSGAGYQQIADATDYADASGAFRAFQRALDRLVMEAPEEARLLELVRLDRVQVETYRMAQQGQLGAVDRFLKIQERRAKYMGIDAPVEHEISGPGGGPIQITEVIIELEDDGDPETE